jgi:hypothetical protein
MIALEVSKNGIHICTAGANDLAVLNAIISATGALGSETEKAREDQAADFYLRVGGLTARLNAPDDHLSWNDGDSLALGDRIEVKIIDTTSIDLPTSISPVNEARHEQRLKEQFEYAKAFYFQHKDQFENTTS